MVSISPHKLDGAMWDGVGESLYGVLTYFICSYQYLLHVPFIQFNPAILNKSDFTNHQRQFCMTSYEKLSRIKYWDQTQNLMWKIWCNITLPEAQRPQSVESVT